MQKAYVSIYAQIRLEEDACASKPDVTKRPLNRLRVASDSCLGKPLRETWAARPRTELTDASMRYTRTDYSTRCYLYISACKEADCLKLVHVRPRVSSSSSAITNGVGLAWLLADERAVKSW